MIKNNNGQLQIRKKLQNIRDQKQLQKLLAKVEEQNRNLVKDIKGFKQQIDDLMAKQNQGGTQDKDKYQKDKIQFQKLQKLLAQKYKQMRKLKKQLGKNEQLQDVKITKQKLFNEQLNIEKKTKQYKKQISDLKVVISKLNKTLQQWQKQDNCNQPKIKQLSSQNKQMREKIKQIVKNDHVKEYQSIKVQTNLFQQKKKVRTIQARKSMFNLKSQPVKTKVDIIAQYQNLQKQVKQLKGKVTSIQENQQILKYQKIGMREHLKKNNLQQVQNTKNLQSRRNKALNQNNYWKKKWLDKCKHIEKLRNRTVKVQNQCQAQQYVDPQPLRRQYAGILGRIRSDDRLVLQDNKTTKIVGLTIYQTDRGLSAVKAHYDNQEQSYMPLPPHWIAKCKQTKIGAGQDDFFKLFKVKFNTLDGKIIKIQARSNKNVRYQYGDKKPFNEVSQGDIVYGFDIRIHEYPVCFISSYLYVKGTYYMQGMGLEINDLQ